MVIAEHKDVLVIGLHEITLAGYLLDGFGIARPLLQLLRVVFVLGIIPLYLVLEVAYLQLILDALAEAVVAYHTHHDCTQYDYDEILVMTEQIAYITFTKKHIYMYYTCKNTKYHRNFRHF